MTRHLSRLAEIFRDHDLSISEYDQQLQVLEHRAMHDEPVPALLVHPVAARLDSRSIVLIVS